MQLGIRISSAACNEKTIKMSFINILLVNSLLIVTIKSEEQALTRDKLLSDSGYTEDNTPCKHTYRIKNICDYVDCRANVLLDPSKEVIEVLCEDSALDLTYCKQYTAEVEAKVVEGDPLTYVQNVACVNLGRTVNDSVVDHAAGITILILVGAALLLGVAGLAFINFRLRRKVRDLENSGDATEIDNKHYTGTDNEGLDLEEGRTT